VKRLNFNSAVKVPRKNDPNYRQVRELIARHFIQNGLFLSEEPDAKCSKHGIMATPTLFGFFSCVECAKEDLIQRDIVVKREIAEADRKRKQKESEEKEAKKASKSSEFSVKRGIRGGIFNASD